MSLQGSFDIGNIKRGTDPRPGPVTTGSWGAGSEQVSGSTPTWQNILWSSISPGHAVGRCFIIFTLISEHLRPDPDQRRTWGCLLMALRDTWRSPQSQARCGLQQGLSVHTTFFCSSAMARRTQLSRLSRSLQLSGARLLYRQGTLSSSPSSCRATSRNCSSELPSRCRPFLQSRDVQPEDSKVGRKYTVGFSMHCRRPGQSLGCEHGGPIQGSS